MFVFVPESTGSVFNRGSTQSRNCKTQPTKEKWKKSNVKHGSYINLIVKHLNEVLIYNGNEQQTSISDGQLIKLLLNREMSFRITFLDLI